MDDQQLATDTTVKHAKSNIVEHRDSAKSIENSVKTIISDDPACYFILNLVVAMGFQKISALKSYLSTYPELESLVDTVLYRMEEANLIKISKDHITILQRELDYGGSPSDLQGFLPNLFRIASKRVISNEAERPQNRKMRREMVRWFTFPDIPELAKEIQAIDLEYKAKMTELYHRHLQHKSKGDGMRFVGIVDCIMEAEDFT